MSKPAQGLDPAVIAEAVDRFSLMPFFPSDPGAKRALVRVLSAICASDKQVFWLAQRTAQLHDKWPGEREVRAVFCSKFKPKDGIEVESDIYPDGIPSELPARNYELLGPAKEQRQITGESGPVTADDDLNTRICDLAKKLSLRELLDKQRPMLAARMDVDKAIYKFKCACCDKQSLLGVPLDARKFSCPENCGAVYEQWVTITGSYQILCVSMPQTETLGGAA